MTDPKTSSGSRPTAADGSDSKAESTVHSTEPSIRVVMMPKDTNAHGTIFGGVILSYIDQAAAVAAKMYGAGFIVTVAMHEVVFHQPVYVGDLVSFYTRVAQVGRTSITVQVEVFAESDSTENRVRVTEAEVTFVNLDKERKPIPIVKKVTGHG